MTLTAPKRTAALPGYADVEGDLAPQLIRRARAGDAEALNFLARQYAPQILRYLQTRLADVLPPDADLGEDEAAAHADSATVLVVEDNAVNRDTLVRNLKRHGHRVASADNGRQAMALMRERAFDVVLLDIRMPEMDGYEVLEQVRGDPQLRTIPVVVVSAVDDLASIVRCVELGAEDYLFKPFDPILLKARVSACVEKKRLRDQEQAHLAMLHAEQERSERLLLNVLPAPIAGRLKSGERTIAESFESVTVLFADIVGFSDLTARLAPKDLVGLLNRIFSRFDELADRYGLEKIKTIGDAYMAVAGVPTPREDHAAAAAAMAIEMQRAIAECSLRVGDFGGDQPPRIQLRIGIHTGPAVAGVIGTRKFSYDLWGDTVNIASRMESLGVAGEIQVSETAYELLRGRFHFEARGPILLKGKGVIRTYLLLEGVVRST